MIIGIKKVALNCFLIGLKPEITALIGFQNLSSLEEATNKAAEHEKIIEIQKNLCGDNYEQEELRRRVQCYNVEAKNDEKGTGDQRDVTCYSCQGKGHMSRYCTASMREVRPRRNEGGNSKDRCYHCNIRGHSARHCRKKQEEEKERERNNKGGRVEYSCIYCERDGYTDKYCKKRRYDQEQCSYCGARGHRVEMCNREEREQEKGKEEKPNDANLNMK